MPNTVSPLDIDPDAPQSVSFADRCDQGFFALSPIIAHPDFMNMGTENCGTAEHSVERCEPLCRIRGSRYKNQYSSMQPKPAS